ncbi:MAG: hypothetical protein GXO78_04930 [Calditrichaeota bacterium]|nr:hypothetical protein [Calditrichota bacterium]
MKIDFINNALNSIMGVDRSHKIRAVQREDIRTDKAEFSREAKKMAKKQKALSPERLQEIKRRIAEGYYDRDEILKEIAERMLNSKDFQEFMKSRKIDRNI